MKNLKSQPNSCRNMLVLFVPDVLKSGSPLCALINLDLHLFVFQKTAVIHPNTVLILSYEERYLATLRSTFFFVCCSLQYYRLNSTKLRLPKPTSSPHKMCLPLHGYSSDQLRLWRAAACAKCGVDLVCEDARTRRHPVTRR